MTGPFRSMTNPVVDPPPPAPAGGEREVITVRAAYLMGLLHDLSLELASAAQVEWVSDAADSFRDLVQQVRERRDALALELEDVRAQIRAIEVLHVEAEQLEWRVRRAQLLGGVG